MIGLNGEARVAGCFESRLLSHTLKPHRLKRTQGLLLDPRVHFGLVVLVVAVFARQNGLLLRSGASLRGLAHLGSCLLVGAFLSSDSGS